MKAYLVTIKTKFDRERTIIMYAENIKDAYMTMTEQSDIYGAKEIIKIIKSTVLNS